MESNMMSSAPASMKFPCRLHQMLDNSPKNNIDHIVSWLPGGTAFAIHDQNEFLETVMPIHFPGMTSYKSFRRQLSLYGIHQRRRPALRQRRRKARPGSRNSPCRQMGAPTGIYFHPLLIRGDNKSCKLLSRSSGNKSSPMNEKSNAKRELATELFSLSSGASIDTTLRGEPSAPRLVAGQYYSCQQSLFQPETETNGQAASKSCVLYLRQSQQERKEQKVVNGAPLNSETAACGEVISCAAFKQDCAHSPAPAPSTRISPSPLTTLDHQSSASSLQLLEQVVDRDRGFPASFIRPDSSCQAKAGVPCEEQANDEDRDIINEIISTFLR